MHNNVSNSLMDLLGSMLDDCMSNPKTELTQEDLLVFATTTLCLYCKGFDDVIGHVEKYRGEPVAA